MSNRSCASAEVLHPSVISTGATIRFRSFFFAQAGSLWLVRISLALCPAFPLASPTLTRVGVFYFVVRGQENVVDGSAGERLAGVEPDSLERGLIPCEPTEICRGPYEHSLVVRIG